MKHFLSLLFFCVLVHACQDYIVTASRLNVRNSPSANSASISSYAEGSVVCVESVSGGWARIGEGRYLSMDFLKKSETSTNCDNYTVTASHLNVRDGPSTTADVVGGIYSGTVVCVTDISNNWAKLDTGKYVSADFIEKENAKAETTSDESADKTQTDTNTSGTESECSGSKTASCSYISAKQFAKIFPNVKSSDAQTYADYLIAAFKESEINTKLRVVHFLAQVGHESAGLFYWEEIHDGSDYENSSRLGNTQPGDGVKFKGRGPIQVTGRYNYNLCGEYLKLDLLNNPTLLSQPQYGFRAAAWFWQYREINSVADRDDIVGVTRLVNGGTTGLDDRIAWLAKIKKEFGI